MSFVPQRSALLERLVAAFAIALPLLLLFAPALRSGQTIAYRDAGHFYYPLYQWIAEQWGDGNLPGWNPLEGTGAAVVDDASSGVFYPGKIAFALPLSFSLRYNLFLVGHCVLAAVGVYWLARRWQTSRHAAALAVISYACSGSVAFQCCNAIFLIGAAWLPFAWLAIDCIVQRPTLRAVIGLATVLAMMILAGDPQMAVHVLLGGGLYLVLRAFRPNPGAADAAADRPKTEQSRFRSVLVSGLALSIAAGVACLLAAVQILPTRAAARGSARSHFTNPRNLYESALVLAKAEATQHSALQPSVVRGLFAAPPNGSHHQSVYDFSIGPWRLAEFVWPNFYGRMFPTHRRWLNALPAEGRIWTPSLYMGLLPIVFALSQFRLRGGGDLRGRWLSWSVLLFGVGSFGWYGLGWASHEIYAAAGGDTTQLKIGQPFGGIYWLLVTAIPGYVQFRYPAKLMVVASLAVSILAAKGWDAWWRRPTRSQRFVLLGLVVVSVVGLAVSWGLSDWFHTRPWQDDPIFGPFDASGALADLRVSLTTAAAVSSVAIFLLSAKHDASKSLRAVLLLLVTAADIGAANAWFIATAPAQIWERDSALAMLIRRESHDSSRPPRLFRSHTDPNYPATFASTASRDRIAEVSRWEHDTIFPKHHLPLGLVNVDSSSSLQPIDLKMLWSIASDYGSQGSSAYNGADASALPHPRVLLLLGTEFLLLPASVSPSFADEIEFPAELAERYASLKLWRMRELLPSAWPVHQVVTLPKLGDDANSAAVSQRATDVLFHSNVIDMRSTAIVETNQRLQLPVAPKTTAAATCTVTGRTATEIFIDAQLPDRALVVVNIAYHSEWNAIIDNRAQTVLRTNRVQCGVVAPAGRSKIILRYTPRNVFRGAWLSGGSLIGIVALLLLDVARRRRTVRVENEA